ncbi:MAG: 3'-5' exonuclease, partial [Pseudomonadota bacterium]
EQCWNLLRDVSRLNIKTIDGFCSTLTRQMPILSQFGGQVQVLDDADELYRSAVQNLFAQMEEGSAIGEDVAELLLHFDNNWERLQQLLIATLARRDQWRHYVGVHHSPQESEAYLIATVRGLVSAQLEFLHRELAPYHEDILALLQFATTNLGETSPTDFPGYEAADLPAWRQLRTLLQTKSGTWRRKVTKNEGFPAGKENEARKAQLKDVIAALARADGLEAALRDVANLPETESGGRAWQLLLNLSRVLPVLAAELLLAFVREGAVDYTQVTLAALQALGPEDAPSELALRLDYQIEHILVDEFQDTAIAQYELVDALTRGWATHNAAHPQAPRTLMIVGDAMQSIYGFRGANVSLFLTAMREGFNGVRLEPVQLQSNFRSDGKLVAWVNHCFSTAFPVDTDIGTGRISYSPSAAARPETVGAVASVHAFTGESARSREAAFICDNIARDLSQADAPSIAVLGRTRTHLREIMSELQQRGIAFNAIAMDTLASSDVVDNLMALSRALADEYDRIAWVAVLRAPWCALSLADILRVCQHGDTPRHSSIWQAISNAQLQESLSPEGRRQLEAILPALKRALAKRDRLSLRVWIEQTWHAIGGPASADDLQALHQAEAFLQLLEHADQLGVGMDLSWLQQRLDTGYVEGGTGEGRVQVMTLHKAKGLEFDCVYIPQLARTSRGDDRQLMLWDERANAEGVRSFLLAMDDHSEKHEPTLYNFLAGQKRDKAQLEHTRLLYVGVTRAIEKLVLTAGLSIDERDGELRDPPDRSLLGGIWQAVKDDIVIHPEADVPLESAVPEDQGNLFRIVQPIGESSAATGGDEDGRKPSPMQLPADNHYERSIGSVVHLAMQDLSLRRTLPDVVAHRDRQHWRIALADLGLWGDELESALTETVRTVTAALQQDSPGRWILSNGHRDSHSEWALTWFNPQSNKAEDVIIDRSFVDADTGIRWLIDYKTSEPEPEESFEAFITREEQRYLEQLTRYRDALLSRGEDSVRCALFFTAMGHLHEVRALNTAAVNEAT